MSDFQKPVRKKNAFNNSKLRLSAPNPNAKGVFSNLSWDVYQNNPRIVVDTRDPNLSSPENSYGRIQAAMDPLVFSLFLNFLKEAIESPSAVKFKIENFSFEYTNGQRAQEASHTSDVWVGKDAEGQMFITVVSKKGTHWPVIKFIFGPSDERFHKFYRGDGTSISKAELSVYAAKGYTELLPLLMANVLDTHYYDVPPSTAWKNKQAGGSGGYGGGVKSYGANDGQNKPAGNAEINDNDLPF